LDAPVVGRGAAALRLKPGVKVGTVIEDTMSELQKDRPATKHAELVE
jgi:hypothetical protein